MKVILLTTLLLFSVNGFAFNWKLIGENSIGSSFYVDVDSIKKFDGLVYYWELSDWIEPSDGVFSYTKKYKVNCGEEKQTQLSLTTYSQQMGKGRTVHEITPNQIKFPKPNTLEYAVMKFACKNAR